MMSNSRLVSFTLFVPFVGIPHAGGEYVRRHYDTLSEFFDISVIAPESANNLDAVGNLTKQCSFNVKWLYPAHKRGQVGIKLIKFFRGVSLGVDLEYSFARQSDLLQLVADADVIEFQWTESASVIRRVRSLAPTARTVIVAHDVVSQRWRREAATGSFARRAFYSGRAYFTLIAERRRYRSVDAVIVFSNKDAALAAEIAPVGKIHTVNPPLADDDMVDRDVTVNDSGRSVLFTGAFSRPENHEAAMWLLEHVWPTVLRAVPDAKLTLAGADPLPKLQEAVQSAVGVELTGYVEDLGAYYRSSDVFVAPLFHGAGVKFKNITAMLWGVPILTTPIGAEGIGTDEHYLAVTDDAEEFAVVLVSALRDPNQRRSVALGAREWAQGRFSRDKFRNSLSNIYL